MGEIEKDCRICVNSFIVDHDNDNEIDCYDDCVMLNKFEYSQEKDDERKNKKLIERIEAKDW